MADVCNMILHDANGWCYTVLYFYQAEKKIKIIWIKKNNNVDLVVYKWMGGNGKTEGVCV